MVTIGDTVSRLRNTIKAVKEDAFITDRFLYSLIVKYAKAAIKKQMKENKKGGGGIGSLYPLFETIPCVELIDVDKIEACCAGIQSNCTIKRTKDKLPDLNITDNGPMFGDVGSIDGSILAYATTPGIYTAMANTTTFKYNKFKYYWYSEGYVYFPNVEWEAASIEALFSESINYLKCDGDSCGSKQDEISPFPEDLFAEVEKMALADLGFSAQIAPETIDDKQSTQR